MTSLEGASPPPVKVSANETESRRMDRLIEWVFGLFGVWTLGVHLTVLRGGNLFDAQRNVALALGVSTVLYFLLRRFGAPVTTPLGSADENPAPLTARVRMGGALLAIAAATTLAFVPGASRIVWAVALASVIFASIKVWKLRPAASAPRNFRNQSLVLGALALLCAAAVLFVHRADLDDSFYINIAVSIADMPGEALLSWDTMHGFRDAPILLPVYRLHTLEVLVGALSHWTGIAAIRVFHNGVPLVFALLAPFVFARVLRLLAPRRWLIGVALVIGFYLLIGDPHRGFTNFGFVRLHQGKSILLTLLLPLICAQSMEFALAPGLRRWATLFLMQVAAVGLTANAVWMAPVMVGLALGSTISLDAQGFRRLFIGLASTVYPLGAALLIRASTVSTLNSFELPFPDEGLFRDARAIALGNEPIGWLALLAIFGGWCFVRGGIARRMLAVFPLVLLVLFWNPLNTVFVADALVGRPTYWRVFWILPLPIFVALFMLQWLRSESGRIDVRWRSALALLVFVGVYAARFAIRELPKSTDRIPDPVMPAMWLQIVREIPLPTLFAAMIWSIGLERKAGSRVGWKLSGVAFAAFCLMPNTYTLGRSKKIFYGPPQPKVTQLAYDAAERIGELAPQGSMVLAPYAICAWIPTVHGHPYPLLVRQNHMRSLRGRVLSPKEVAQRVHLTEIVSGGRRPRNIVALLEKATHDFDLSLICLADLTKSWSALRPAVEAAGFELAYTGKRYEIWTRRQ